MEAAQQESQIKIIVPLEKEEPDYPPFDYEELWSTPAGEGLFRIENVPFFARGIARGDIVSAVAEGEVLRFQEVFEASGHSTIRLIVNDSKAVPGILERFEGQGCSGEVTFGKLVALDVPPTVSLEAIREKLDLGYAQSQWDYEEACIFQPAEESPAG
jgi:hypothetical protein